MAERVDGRPDVEMLVRPSFHRELSALRVEREVIARQDTARLHPQNRFNWKLRNYELATSHGVPTPAVLGVWANVSQVRLDDLPDQVVLKSDGGASGAGVLPLHRVGSDKYRVMGRDDILDTAGVRGYLSMRFKRGQAYGVVFAEEFITPSGRVLIPEDLKFYTAYGKVMQILVRSVTRLRDAEAVEVGYFSPDGESLGEVALGQRYGDVVLPEKWDSALDHVAHLSKAVGVPFMRVDMYLREGGPVLGELTPSPGGRQEYVKRHDRAMGLAWLEGAAALECDLVAGRPAGILYGNRVWQSLYLPGHASRTSSEGSWLRTRGPCVWCSQTNAVGG